MTSMITVTARQGHTLALIAYNGKGELMVLPDGDLANPSSLHYGLPMMELDSDNLMYCTNRLLGRTLGKRLELVHTIRCVRKETPVAWKEETLFCHPLRITQDTDTIGEHAEPCYHSYAKPVFLPEAEVLRLLSHGELALDTLRLLQAVPDLLFPPETEPTDCEAA